MKDNEIRANLATNLVFYRRQANLTQAQLADLLSYSDKAISKWERGEGVPDIYIISRLAEIFHVSIDDLISKNRKSVNNQRTNRIVITLLSAGLVWVVAALIFVILKLCYIPVMVTFLPFFYGLFCSAVVVLVFSFIWGSRLTQFISITVLIWTFLTAIFYTMYIYGINEAYVVYLLGLPSQLIDIFFFFFKKNKKADEAA